jgi:hypothetical protein
MRFETPQIVVAIWVLFILIFYSYFKVGHG